MCLSMKKVFCSQHPLDCNLAIKKLFSAFETYFLEISVPILLNVDAEIRKSKKTFKHKIRDMEI